MSNISYSNITADKLKVFLENKLVGYIKPRGKGYAYYVKGTNYVGEEQASIAAVKKTIEDE